LSLLELASTILLYIIKLLIKRKVKVKELLAAVKLKISVSANI
jgi:hypothetical protein